MKASALLRDMRRHLFPVADLPDEPAEARHWTLSNVAGMHVYATPAGWHCDLAFEGMPVGVGNVVGAIEPCPSRQEALVAGTLLLSVCARRENGTGQHVDATTYSFRFDDCHIPVHGTMVADYAKEGGSTVDGVQAWLAELRYGIRGNEALVAADWGRMDDETRMDVVRACTAAMAIGMKEFTLADAYWIPGPTM